MVYKVMSTYLNTLQLENLKKTKLNNRSPSADAYWQSDQAIVSRLHHLAQERVKRQWTEEGIWKDPWDHKVGAHYKVEGGWPHRLDGGTGDRVGTPQRSPTRIPWRSSRKRRDELERCRSVMEDASRPFRMFLSQLLRARQRLGSSQGGGGGGGGGASPDDALSSRAHDEVKAAWVRRGVWLASWEPLPGMTWGHEKPLREFVAETRPELSPLCVEGRAQRWAEELVGAREAGTWERDADVRGLVWTIPTPQQQQETVGGGGDHLGSETLRQKSAMGELIPALLSLKQPPDPPGLFGKPEGHLATTAPRVLKIAKPTPPSWGLVQVPQDKKGGQRKLDFRVFDFPWDMPLSQTYYRDGRFKKSVARRLRRDFNSAAEAEDYYDMEHLKATQGAEREFRISAEAEDQLARRHEGYRRWEREYVLELKRYQAQFKKIDWKDFKLPDDAALGTELWADARFRAEILRRVPGLAAEAYLAEHRRCKALLLVPTNEAWTIGVEEEDSLQRRWEAQKKRTQPKKRKRTPKVV